METLLRLPAVKAATGLSRSEIYRRIALGEFPASVPIGTRARAWPASAVEFWVKARIGEAAQQ
jgi:prophage regulatory protein